MSSSDSSGDVYVETLAVFDRREDPTEPLTTPEVADTLDVARRTVYKRLEKLASRGDLKTKKAGANARVWWRPLESSPPRPSAGDDGRRLGTFEPTAEEVLGRITDGFYGVDDQFQFTYVNDGAEGLFDVDASAVLGRDIRDELVLTDEFEAALRRAYETQEPVVIEDYSEPRGAWFENVIYPSASGLSVSLQDVSERKRLEHALQTEEEHFRTALENSPLVAFRLDTDLRYTWVANPHEHFDPDAVIGKRDDELLPPDAAETIMAPKRRALETGETVREELTYELPTGLVTYDLTVVPLRDETGDVVGLTAASLDLTERKEVEEALRKSEERFRLALEAGQLGAWELDLQTDEAPVRSPLHDRIFGHDECEDWSFEQFMEHVHPDDRAWIRESFETAFETEEWTFECRIIRADGAERWITVWGEFFYDDGEPTRAVGVIRDITERKEREQELRRTTELLEVERARLDTILDRLPVGVWVASDDGELVRKNEEADQIWAGDAPLLKSVEEYTEYTAWDAESDRRLTPEEYPVARAVRTGQSVEPVELRIRRFDDTTGWVLVSAAPITDEDGHPSGAVGINVDITERKQREAEIAALNRLNSVFQEVIDAVIDSPSRERIERAVIDHLEETDAYEYAWIGHLDRHGEHIVPQSTDTDETARYTVSLSTGTEDSTNHRTVADSIRTGTVRVRSDSAAEPVFEQLSRPEGIGHDAMASIPIWFEDRVYGVLVVYTGRENAFDENERDLLGRLGEAVGHAISSIERKRALLGDRVTEVTFRSEELADAYTDAVGDDSFTLSIDNSVVLKKGQTITYYSLDGIAPEVYIDVVETFYPDAECHVVSRTGSRSRVEVKTTEATLASRLAPYNSRIVGGGFENGEFRITVHVLQSADVGEVTGLVTEVYPNTDTVAVAEFERENPDIDDVVSDLNDQLTERQRTTLEVAYFSGFFEWPRAITGEELAERLDVTPGTVSHHLRHGERKLMTAFFESAA